MYNILICDDEKDILSALKIYLSDSNYNLLEAENGEVAIKIAQENELHLILMDVMMPKIDGIQAMVKIREHCNVPIILLTAKSEDNDKILGLNLGADDYITKPFNPVEVIARVKSQLRRYIKLGAVVTTDQNDTIVIGGVELDDQTKKVMVDGEEVSLTPKEYAILKLLMSSAGKVFSLKSIYELAWQESSIGAENTVSVHIRHLREKIEIDPASPRYIKVVWGQGYKFEKGR